MLHRSQIDTDTQIGYIIVLFFWKMVLDHQAICVICGICASVDSYLILYSLLKYLAKKDLIDLPKI